MTLEDFEKELQQEKEREERDRHKKGDGHKERRHRHRHDDDGEHRHSKHHHRHHHREDEKGHESRHKRHRRDEDGEKSERKRRRRSQSPSRELEDDSSVKRDSWMEAPSALDVEYVSQAGSKRKSPPRERGKFVPSAGIKGTVEEEVPSTDYEQAPPAEVHYTFGDGGSKWRMTKLRALHTQSEETGKPVEELAVRQYGDLRTFDDAREEQIELERRETYGPDYSGKEKPSGELFAERTKVSERESEVPEQGTLLANEQPTASTVPLDQTALNRLKAQMMKAKLLGGDNLAKLEAEYNDALAHFANRKQPDVVVLGAMDNRQLAGLGGKRGEVKEVQTTRGRQRGNVEQNDEMSLDDMVREEKRTKGQSGGEGKRFAERIAKDSKFDDDLEYMDENATKLARRVEKSEINLRSTAIGDFQKMNRILDSCPLCFHEDTDTPPTAPVVSLATRSYLTLPTTPEISPGGAMIIPIQHRSNLLECDDDEWEELRNFMKCLTRLYHAQDRGVIFYENAASPERHKHAAMVAVPLPPRLAEQAPAFFRESILASDEEWTQHVKLIDTLAASQRAGMGRQAFRRSLAKEMPYFHVWFELDGGLGHVVEDARRWPKGDLFAREVLGGMLDVDPATIRKQGKWTSGTEEKKRTEGFRRGWEKFDWSRMLGA